MAKQPAKVQDAWFDRDYWAAAGAGATRLPCARCGRTRPVADFRLDPATRRYALECRDCETPRWCADCRQTLPSGQFRWEAATGRYARTCRGCEEGHVAVCAVCEATKPRAAFRFRLSEGRFSRACRDCEAAARKARHARARGAT